MLLLCLWRRRDEQERMEKRGEGWMCYWMAWVRWTMVGIGPVEAVCVKAEGPLP